MIHIPVLQNEVIKYLDPKKNENFIDCTLDGGGHTLKILEKTVPKGKLLGIEWDKEIISQVKFYEKKFKNRLILVNDTYANLEKIVKAYNFKSVSGVLLDLGFSSWHLEKSGRGFTFLKNEPLDMRYNPDSSLTAEKILNYYSLQEIEKILREYGEEKFSLEIAKNIVRFRQFAPIKKTSQLVEIIKKSIPPKYQKINPATRTFQALRIAVNDELKNLEKVLPQILNILKPKGRLVVISFHSLEDRIVKNFFKEKEKENIIKILTKKPIIPRRDEVKINPRARSAKLRAALLI